MENTQPRLRTVGTTVYQRHDEPYAHDLRILDLGHGHVECYIHPRRAWSELEEVSPLEAAKNAQRLARDKQHAKWLKSRPVEHQATQTAWDLKHPTYRDELNRERASRRAKSVIRRKGQHRLYDTMMTFTYSRIESDRSVVHADMTEWLRRVNRLIPGFSYMAVFELQKRGSLHIHMATHQIQRMFWYRGVLVKSYDVMRNIWAAVIGEPGRWRCDSPDQYRRKMVAKGSSFRPSVHSLSRYLCKYISKDVEGAAKHQKRYFSSRGPLPAVIVMRASANLVQCKVDILELMHHEAVSGRLYISPDLSGGGVFMAFSPHPE